MKIYLVIYFILLFLSLVTGVFNLKKDVSFKYIVALISLSIVTEIGNLFTNQHKTGSYIWYHFFTPIEYCLLTFYFLSYFHKKIIRYCIIVSQLIFILFCAFVSINLGLYEEYPSYLVIVEVFLILFWAFFHLFNIKPKLDTTIFNESFFWIDVGLVFYFSGIFFIDGVLKCIISSNRLESLQIYHTIFNCIFNYILYIFIIIGFSAKKR